MMKIDLPTFSIIVPARNRPETLAKCLDALTSLSYPSNCFEVIVVDDDSSLPLEPVVAPFAVSSNITLLRQPKAGPAAARNFGATKAKGIFLAFTDDDCAPSPDWLNVLADQFAKTPDYMIGGQTVNALIENRCSMASQHLISYLYEYYQKDAARDRFFTSNNLALPAELFRVIKGFDTGFRIAAAEDRELGSRWRYHGFKVLYVRDAIVYHSHALTLSKFSRQHFNYGRGAYSYHQIRRRRNQRLTIKSEPITFYLNLLRYPFSKSGDIRAFVSMSLLLLSQIVNVFGFFFEKIKQRGKTPIDDNVVANSTVAPVTKKQKR